MSNLVLVTALTNLLPVTQFGDYVVAIALASSVAAVGSQWIQQGLLRFLPAASADRRGAVLAAAWRSSLTVCSLIVGAGACYWILDPITSWFPANAGSLSVVVATAVAATLLLVGTAALRAQGNSRGFATFSLVAAALKLVLIVATVVFIGASAIWAMAASALATLIVAVMIWPTLIPNSSTRDLAVVNQKRMWEYGKHYVVWFLAAQSFAYVDRLFLSANDGAAVVAVYGAYYFVVAGIVELVAAPLRYATHPAFVRMWENGRQAEVRRVLRLSVLAGLLIALVGAAVVPVVVAWVLAFLMPQEYQQHRNILPILWAALCIWHTAMFAHKLHELHERSHVLKRAMLVTAIIHAVLQYFASSAFGAIGTAVSMLVAFVIYLGWTSLALFRRAQTQ